MYLSTIIRWPLIERNDIKKTILFAEFGTFAVGKIEWQIVLKITIHLFHDLRNLPCTPLNHIIDRSPTLRSSIERHFRQRDECASSSTDQYNDFMSVTCFPISNLIDIISINLSPVQIR